MIGRPLRLLAPLVAVALLLGPIERYASAGFQRGDVACCCGTHAADHDCGCSECPSHHDDDDGDRDGDRGPADGSSRMKACGGSGSLVAPVVAAATLPEVPVLIRPVARATCARDHALDLVDRPVQPETPPF